MFLINMVNRVTNILFLTIQTKYQSSKLKTNVSGKFKLSIGTLFCERILYRVIRNFMQRKYSTDSYYTIRNNYVILNTFVTQYFDHSV